MIDWPEVTESSETIAPSGRWRAIEAPTAAGVSGPLGAPSGRLSGWCVGALRRAERIGQRGQRRRAVLARARPAAAVSQPSGTSTLGLSGIGEEGHRRVGLDQHHQVDAGQVVQRHLAEVHHPVRREAAGAARLAGDEGVGQHPHARRREPAGRRQRRLAAGGRAQQDHRLGRRLAARRAASVDRRRRRRPPWRGAPPSRPAALARRPGAVGRQDQAGRAAGRPVAGADRLGGQRADLVRRSRPTSPSTELAPAMAAMSEASGASYWR